MLSPGGARTETVPVGTVQVGCLVTEGVCAAGPPGATLTVRFVAAEIQPVFTSLAVTE